MGPTLIVEFFRRKLKLLAASTGLSAGFCEIFRDWSRSKDLYYCGENSDYI